MTVTASQVERLGEQLDEVLAAHGSGRVSLGALSRYRSDPVGFCNDVLRLSLGWDKLDDLMLAVRDHPLVVVPGAVATGKDFTAAAIALWWVYARGGLVVLTCATESQVQNVMMATVARLFARNPDLPGTVFNTRLDVPGDTGAGIRTVVGGRVSAATGYHHEHLLAILSEAQDVPAHSWEAALSNATSESSRVLAVGNPLFTRGEFARACRDPDWRKITLDALDHPNIVQGRSVIPGAVSRAGIDRIAAMFGEGSPQYLARVRGQFPGGDDDGALVRRDWILAAFENHRNRRWGKWGIGCPDDAIHVPMSVMGVDVARGGSDSTVAVLRRGYRVFEPWTCPPGDTMETADGVVARCRYLGLEPLRETATVRLLVDEIGVGAGVIDRLRQMGMQATPYNAASTASKSAPECANTRAESYWGLRKLLEEGTLALPPNELLEEELLATHWSVDGQGRILIEPKEAIMRRLSPQRSPDTADAVAIACHQLWRGTRAGGVVLFKNPF